MPRRHAPAEVSPAQPSRSIGPVKATERLISQLLRASRERRIEQVIAAGRRHRRTTGR